MHSYNDRIRAVELYIKLDKRVGATIRRLGYPTKNALKSWHREYERRLDLPKGYARSKPKYSQEQKETAVRHYLDHGRCIAFTIKALGYPVRESLRSWIHELHPELHARVVGRSNGVARPPAMKQAGVIALCTRQGGAHAVAQELGVCRPTLYNWKNQRSRHGPLIPMHVGGRRRTALFQAAAFSWASLPAMMASQSVTRLLISMGS